MANALRKVCPRCSGSGVYAQRGVCFGCAGAGEVFADAFHRAVGASGAFFGISGPVVNGLQFKGIARGNEAEVVGDLMAGYNATPITEAVAREFFLRFGVSTQARARRERD